MGANHIVRSQNDIRDLEGQIARLNKIGIALSAEHDLNRLLNMIVREARHFTNSDGGSLYIREGDKLNFIVAQTESLESLNGRRPSFKSSYLPLTKESIAGYVAITGDILNINDAYLIPPTVEYRLNKDFDNLFGYRTKSMLVVPMRDHEDEIIGVLQLINSVDDKNQVLPFKPAYETLIASLASQAGVAIQNARLIEEIRKLFRSLVRYSAKAIDARSPHTAGHSGRVAKYSVRLMEAINDEKNGRFLPTAQPSPDSLNEMPTQDCPRQQSTRRDPPESIVPGNTASRSRRPHNGQSQAQPMSGEHTCQQQWMLLSEPHSLQKKSRPDTKVVAGIFPS